MDSTALEIVPYIRTLQQTVPTREQHFQRFTQRFPADVHALGHWLRSNDVYEAPQLEAAVGGTDAGEALRRDKATQLEQQIQTVLPEMRGDPPANVLQYWEQCLLYDSQRAKIKEAPVLLYDAMNERRAAVRQPPIDANRWISRFAPCLPLLLSLDGQPGTSEDGQLYIDSYVGITLASTPEGRLAQDEAVPRGSSMLNWMGATPEWTCCAINKLRSPTSVTQVPPADSTRFVCPNQDACYQALYNEHVWNSLSAVCANEDLGEEDEGVLEEGANGRSDEEGKVSKNCWAIHHMQQC